MALQVAIDIEYFNKYVNNVTLQEAKSTKLVEHLCWQVSNDMEWVQHVCSTRHWEHRIHQLKHHVQLQLWKASGLLSPLQWQFIELLLVVLAPQAFFAFKDTQFHWRFVTIITLVTPLFCLSNCWHLAMMLSNKQTLLGQLVFLMHNNWSLFLHPPRDSGWQALNRCNKWNAAQSPCEKHTSGMCASGAQQDCLSEKNLNVAKFVIKL